MYTYLRLLNSENLALENRLVKRAGTSSQIINNSATVTLRYVTLAEMWYVGIMCVHGSDKMV